MTTTYATAEAIQTALAATMGGVFSEKATNLLAALGYRSDHVPPRQPASVGDFIAEYPAPNPGTQSELTFVDNAQSVRILFQFTNAEITSTTQRTLLNPEGFSTGNARSFLFVAVELKADNYARGQYVTFTREINKRWQIPTVVLFRTPSSGVTLSFVHRRQNRRDPDRDVLGSVSLIREIDAADPHRAHLDILDELSLPARLRWMDSNGKPHNFDGLLDAWLDALDTEELNRCFYRDLFRWSQRAVIMAKFPAAATKTVTSEEHIIRLITRLLFVWFIKEKDLVADGLFNEYRVAQLLKDYDAADGDSYYRAVLQNLFFATLNTEIGDRRFSQENNDDHSNFSLYCYRNEMADPDALLGLFDLTPFINGGLFDCLDSFDGTRAGGVRIDCFTDSARHRAGYSIPNRLFFGQDTNGGNPGLITLFNRYKFTVEENTPAEREVALDPELLGKVFENLLAAFNPETRENARKQTGSYYTPRAVVDYMVDEALVATLAQKSVPPDGDGDLWQERLRYLLDYDDAFSDAETLFAPAEREAIVRGIAETKVLDPAVGSGAFPMGVLHKLTLALRRLDPQNELWESLQKELAVQRAASAFDTADQAERDAELQEISDTFERYRDTDFGRKLYLIQNGIYGVDIQPIATQIAKLRFFISLAIDQESNDDPDANYGIKPLPNLETRFVAADSLLGLERPAQMALGETGEVQQLHGRIRANRERHFHASTRQQKQRYRREDERLRQELAKALQDAGFAAASAKQIADWDPYDQNASAGWFDGEYMFGVGDGFDVVIGNPPYVESRNSLLSAETKDAYLSQVTNDWGETLPRGSDLLMYFFARTPTFFHGHGSGYLIAQNAWLSTDYGKRFQDFSLGKFSVPRVIDTSARFFSDRDGPQINAVITVLDKQRSEHILYEVVNDNMVTATKKTLAARQSMKWGHVAAMPQFFFDMLTEMRGRAGNGNIATFGQGINLRSDEINRPGSSVPIILKETSFIAQSAGGRIRASALGPTRKNKIPALIMPRGIGNRYYCTFNACNAYSLSGVELYLPDALWETDLHYCLWAYFNSSLAWLFREVTGRRNLGGGMLKAEATDIKQLPMNFNFDFADGARQVLNRLSGRSPLPLRQEIATAEHLEIDHMVSEYLGYTEVQDEIRNALLELVEFRANRSRH